MLKIGLSSNKGFSLVEVLVALALLATIGVGIITALGGATKVLLRADTHETARDIAEAQMESVQNQNFQVTAPDYAEISVPTGWAINTSATQIEDGLQEIEVIVFQGSEEKYSLTGQKVNW